MNKSLLTNIVSLLICLYGYFSPVHSYLILVTGAFALSGGITNWLAIHMLFEKVPFLYGSGVIPNRFEEFKIAIKSLIIEQFFTREHIDKIFKESSKQEAQNIADIVDFDKVFIGLTDAIESSHLGTMLNMIGGKEALQPLREPITLKLKDIIADLANEGTSGAGDCDLTDTMIIRIAQIIDKRLEELTPETVKQIIQGMIKTHLGWLVVWGSVFGGAIGLAVGVLD